MRRIRNRGNRRPLFGRVRRHRLKYITLLPSLITILNGVFGFAAIAFAAKGTYPGIGNFTYFEMAGYMVLLAMFADMLDGRLARMSQHTSSFGGQLDSLCDLVSFGVAPAFLMLTVVEATLQPAGFMYGSFRHRFIWLAALVYMSCAAIRLARFNVENDESEAAHMSFVGLPSPAAAGVIVSLIILHQQEASNLVAIVYALPFLALGAAVLMVSRVRYPHILNQYLKGEKPFAHLIKVLLFLGLVLWSMQAALALIFCGFAAGSPLKWLYQRVIRKKVYPAIATDGPALGSSSEGQIGQAEHKPI